MSGARSEKRAGTSGRGGRGAYPPRRVLLATDGSEDAALASRATLDLARGADSELHVVHAWRSVPTRRFEAFVRVRLQGEARELLEAQAALLGKGSGKTYTTPVNYVRDGEALLLVAPWDHRWWKNLGGGAPVKLRVRGRDEECVAEACEDPATEEALFAVLRAVPADRRHWDVRFGPDGSLRNPEDLTRVSSAAKKYVPVRVKVSREK